MHRDALVDARVRIFEFRREMGRGSVRKVRVRPGGRTLDFDEELQNEWGPRSSHCEVRNQDVQLLFLTARFPTTRFTDGGQPCDLSLDYIFKRIVKRLVLLWLQETVAEQLAERMAPSDANLRPGLGREVKKMFQQIVEQAIKELDSDANKGKLVKWWGPDTQTAEQNISWSGYERASDEGDHGMTEGREIAKTCGIKED